MISEDRQTIAECLKSLGLDILSKDAKKSNSWSVLIGYIHLIEKKARQEKREDLLEVLWSCGLIYY